MPQSPSVLPEVLLLYLNVGTGGLLPLPREAAWSPKVNGTG